MAIALLSGISETAIATGQSLERDAGCSTISNEIADNEGCKVVEQEETRSLLMIEE